MFVLGPGMSGLLVNAIGFQWMLTIIGLVCIAYAPCMFFLKNPPAKGENIVSIFMLNQRSVRAFLLLI